MQEEHAPDHDFSFSNSFGHAIAGAAGTAVSNVVVYPLDLVVTRLQIQSKKRRAADPEKADAQNKDEEQYDGLVDAFNKIYAREGGLPAFYSGVVQDTFKSMTDSFLFFLTYNALCSVRQPSKASDRSAFSRALDEVGIGMVAGAVTKGLTFPLQQVVTRRQAGPRNAESMRDIFADIYKRNGITGFWAGYGATLVLTLNPSLSMSVHSMLERLTVGEGNAGDFLTFLFAASAKAFASCAMYPVSLAKTRAQASGGSGSGSGPLGVMRAIVHMAKNEGAASLYAGVGGEVLKGFFSHGLTMLVKGRVQGVVVAVYFWLLKALKEQRARKI